MSEKDPEHSPASVVGAPPYALPLEDGGEAAVVGHPASPATLADSPVRGDTDGLDAPWEAKGGAKVNVDPVLEDKPPVGDTNPEPVTTGPEVTEPTRHAKKTTARKTAKKSAARR